MPNRIIIEVEGSTSIEIPLKLTPLQIRNIFRRAAVRLSISTEGLTNQQIARRVMIRALKWIMDKSIEQQRHSLVTDYQITVEQTISTDNNLLDPE